MPASSKSPDKVDEGKCGGPTHCSVESSAFLACDVAEAQNFSDYCATQDPVSCTRTEAAISNEHGEIQLETKVKTCALIEDSCWIMSRINSFVYDYIQVDGSFSEFEALDVVSEVPISTGMYTIICVLFSYYYIVCEVCWIKSWVDLGSRAEKFQPKLRVKKGKENPNIPPSEVESTTLSQAANFGMGDMDESSLRAFPPGDVHDPLSPNFCDSIAPNPTPNFQRMQKALQKLLS